MSHTSVRTQIYLPEDLRKDIESQRSRHGESMAEYIRIATDERVKNDKKKVESLKELAKRVFGGPPRQTAKEIDKRIKQIRKERREDDDYMEARLQKALNQVGEKKK